MRRVCTGSQLGSLPSPNAAIGTPGFFSTAAPGLDVVNTVPGPDWFNSVQEELIAILTAAGVSPDNTGATLNQILASLNILYAPAVGNASQTFKVANATASSHAVALGQFDSSTGTESSLTLPNGIIMKFGTFSITAVNGDTTYNHNYPAPFPTNCFFAMGSLASYSTTNTAFLLTASANGLSEIGYTIVNGSGSSQSVGIAYIAIGN